MKDIHAYAFADILHEMDDATSRAVQISYGQVLGIVVEDLIDKYKFNIARGNSEWALAFEKVLRYYLDDQEMSQLISNGACASCEYKPCDGIPQNHADYCPARTDKKGCEA